MFTISPQHKLKTWQKNILTWYDQWGRKNLPWQHPITPYTVYLSEIMLQQTQVRTVIPYFNKFITAFPSIQALASAERNEVLALWAGLGYYARARNLHRAAQLIQEKHAGIFPQDLDSLIQLPGIGLSTAGAIRSIAFNQKTPILDGNVKRILARYFSIEEPIDSSTGLKLLWDFAEKLTPKHRVAAYTQAMMDLGATICTRTKPNCHHCPLQSSCTAYAKQTVLLYPQKKRKAALPIIQAYFLLLRHKKNAIYLHKREEKGLWGGLWSLPQFQTEKSLFTFCTEWNIDKKVLYPIPKFRHSFTHYHLEIYPYYTNINKIAIKKIPQGEWVSTKNLKKYGKPAAIQKILKKAGV